MQTILSVKLEKIDFGQKNLTIKTSYPENKSEKKNPDNELEGVYNYLPVVNKLKEIPSASRAFTEQSDAMKFLMDVHGILMTSLKEQDIGQGEVVFKLKEKNKEVSKEKNPATFRISGSVSEVNINHAKFHDTDQKWNDIGDSVESLSWTVKLESQDQSIPIEKLNALQQDENFTAGISQAIRDKLSAGKALEIANQSVRQIVQENLKKFDIQCEKITLQLKRAGLTDLTEVVIGEKHFPEIDSENEDSDSSINLPSTDDIQFASLFLASSLRHRFSFDSKTRIV